ncbi:divalent-cation tolerance protein CutA [Arcobacter vandammei]|uniref:divalent-cation tolerance protein CutA n=1 Tax=Arcobacter vandammei TaxID=2782243 RepID=UPI0018DF85BB|nr:divalent-cation tolerance protein CutA [Arcobacter vandammei]
MKAIMIQTTFTNQKEAEDFAQILIKEKLAACVQTYDIKSFYFWEKRVCSDNETLLNIKTRKSCFKKIKSKILELHSYDLPEIISIKLKNVSKEYLKFIKENTK